MKLGLNFVRVAPRHMPELAREAEVLGYESVFVPDHVVFPVQSVSKYPGTKDGNFPHPRNTPLYDPWVVLTTIASATRTIRLGTAVYVLPLRHPIVAARDITTVDVVSGGRVLVGIGLGWLTEEFDVLGIDPRRRFSRAEEAAVILRKLWTEAEPSFSGKNFAFDRVHFEPKPLSRPHPPLLFGGDSEAALIRALRFGDGWLSGGVATNVGEVARLVGRLRELRSELGDAIHRDQPFTISVLYPCPSADDLAAMEKLGVDRVVVMPWERNRDAPIAIERFMAHANDNVAVDAT
jgi:probable F420-dependent oxidoreductase